MCSSDLVRIDEEDVTILGRRLYACFADEPGKVEHLFTYFLKEPRVEERLVVLEVASATPARRWETHRRLVRGQLAGRDKAMHTAGDLGETSAWLVFNELFAQSTVVGLIAQNSRATVAELRHLLERFVGLFSVPDPFAIPPGTFLEPRRLSRVAIVVNFDVAREPEDASDKAGIFYLPENWDILNYGRNRQSQLTQVTVVTLNNWGEMFCLRYEGRDALTAALSALLRRIDPSAPPEVPPEVFVPHGRQYQALRNRLGKLLESVYHAAVADLAEERCRAFAYEVGGQFQVIRREGANRRIVRARGLRGVFRQLGGLGLLHQEAGRHDEAEAADHGPRRGGGEEAEPDGEVARQPRHDHAGGEGDGDEREGGPDRRPDVPRNDVVGPLHVMAVADEPPEDRRADAGQLLVKPVLQGVARHRRERPAPPRIRRAVAEIGRAHV